MAASALTTPDGLDGTRRKQSPITFGRILVVVGIGLAIVIAWNLTNQETVTERPNKVTTTTVILPPPPPPPPPQPEQVEQPPEPKVAPPIEQPLDSPPPPDASSDPTPGDSALTAREGAGPSNYGLAVGDGGGTRIGGRPGGGGDGFAAYANNVALPCIRQAAQADRELSRGRFTARLAVSVDPSGRITSVGEISGVDGRRSERLREVLTGLQCQAPPAGLPTMRIELSGRSGG